MHVSRRFFEFLTQVGKYLRKKRDDRLFEYLRRESIYLDLLSSLLWLHMFVMICDSVQEGVHAVVISDLCCHEPLDLIYPSLHCVIVSKLC